MDNSAGAMIPCLIVGIVFLLWAYIFLPANMAKDRGRSQIGWIIIFMIITPFWGWVVLTVLGDSKEKFRQEILDDIRRGNSLRS